MVKSLSILILVFSFCFSNEKLLIQKEGFRTENLPNNFKSQVKKIKFIRYDVFEAAKTNIELEKNIYNIIKSIHIKSKQNTIKKTPSIQKRFYY